MDRSKHGKAVKCYLSREDYEKFLGLKERFGFRSNYELCSASIRVMMAVLSSVEEGKLGGLPEEIQGVFSELGDIEVYPTGRRPNRPDNSQYHLLFNPAGVDDGYKLITRVKGLMGKKHGELAGAVSRLTEDEAFRSKIHEWATAFIESYAERLRHQVEQLPPAVREDGYEPMDILNDTLLSLYDCTDRSLVAYVDFEKWAVNKFRKVLSGR